ncbi:MAG TPA: hypothetical protein VIW23_06200 [Candidatus Acidoferrum sp.]|jgi:hypothetical protein
MQNSAYDALRSSSGKVMASVYSTAPKIFRSLSLIASISILAAGCETNQPPKPEQPAVAAKPAETEVPENIRSAADALLGSEAKVLAYGDLAKTGKQQILVANVVPKSPKENITGTIVTRAVIAENDANNWTEIFQCDEHLKNAKGYLGMTPLDPVSGWRLQFEQDPEKGLTLYLTPVKGLDDRHVLPIGVRWNPKTKRYQSLDRTYEQFLNESPSLSTSRSRLQ